MKKTRFLSLMLAVAMILSIVQLPALASDYAPGFFNDTTMKNNATLGSSGKRVHNYWVAPYGDEFVHFDYSASLNGVPASSYQVANNKNDDRITIDTDGIITMKPSFAQGGANIQVLATSGSSTCKSGNFNLVANSPYIFNFDTDPYALIDGIVYANEASTTAPILENAALATDGNGNNYLVPATDEGNINFAAHRPNSAINVTVLQFDVNFSETAPFNIVVNNGGKSIFKWDNATKTLVNNPSGSYPYTNFTDPGVVEPGWHTIKMFLDLSNASDDNNPHRVTYQRAAIFLDDELVTKGFKIPSLSAYSTSNANTKNRVIRFEGSEGIDNFKYYGSGTPHAYNVGLASIPKSGAMVDGSALMYSLGDYTNAETHFNYTYYISDDVDSAGSYTKVTSSNPADPFYITSEGKLAINGDHEGRFIKVGARVWNRGGMSPEVKSKQVFEIQDYNATTVTRGTDSKDARFRLKAPFEGELNWSFIDAPEGASLTEDGLFTITSSAVDTGVFKVQNYETGEVMINYLNFIDNSTDGTELTEVIEPVVFSADIDFATTTTITAGTKTFAVGSDGIAGVACDDGANFKFVVEDDVYYAFADDKFIGSDAFNQDITSITTDGTFTNYYAGSPLVTPGTFFMCQVGNGYDSNWIEAPVFEFYNESGLYPETYIYQWYLNEVPVSNDARYYIPGGSTGKNIYCTVTAVTDTDVVAVSNSSIVGSQYNLTVNAPGEFTVSLNTEDKEIYLFLVGDKKTVFVADMSDGDPVSVILDGTDNYDMFFTFKDTLNPRGVATRILANTSYSDVLLPEGAKSNLVLLARNSALTSVSTGAVLFEDPCTYDDLASAIADRVSGDNREDITAFICDAYISTEVATSYADFEIQPEGAYNLINIDEDGNVEESSCYNKLYKLFDDVANYSYSDFDYIAAKALNFETEDFDVLKANLNIVSNKTDIAPLMGTNGNYFPAAVILQLLSEQDVPSDASLDLYKSYLEYAQLSTDVITMMDFSTFYAEAMNTINRSEGIAATNTRLKDYMILSEVASGKSTTDISLSLTLIGSEVFNNASKDAQKYAAGVVARHTYADVSALKTAVEAAVSQYVPKTDTTNEDSKNNKPSSSISVSGGSFGGGSVIIPSEPDVPSQPEEPVKTEPSTPKFSDVSTSHWSYDYIQKMADKGVLNGYGDDFRPDNNITRAEFVKVLCTAFDIKAEGNVEFDDVSKDSWYAPYVNTLASAGIAKGADGKFRPDEQISRQDAAVLLQRVLEKVGHKLESGELSFSDANDMSDYAKDAIASLVKAGVINGMEDGSYAPAKNITRAQVAKLICVAIELGGDK